MGAGSVEGRGGRVDDGGGNSIDSEWGERDVEKEIKIERWLGENENIGKQPWRQSTKREKGEIPSFYAVLFLTNLPFSCCSFTQIPRG